jgi:hypothetical protein
VEKLEEKLPGDASILAERKDPESRSNLHEERTYALLVALPHVLPYDKYMLLADILCFLPSINSLGF